MWCGKGEDMTTKGSTYRKPIGLALALSLAIGGGIFSCSRADQPAGVSEKVTIALATLPETALAQIAQAKGYFLKEGLDVTPHLHFFGKLALAEVLEGKADFATVAETPVMFAIMEGKGISIIAAIQSSTKNHAIVARKDKGILTPRDLKGRKIGTTIGITADYFTDAFLAMYGISRSEVEVVNLNPEDHEEALARGRVDAVSTFYPYLRRALSRQGENGIAFYEKDIYTETFNVVATKEFIRQNTGKVRKMLRALVKAEGFARDHQAEAQEIVADFSHINIDIVRNVWGDNEFGVSLAQALVLALEDESQWAIKKGLTSAREVPNYLHYIYFDGLKAVKPEAMRILK
jgi:sulfonate transport system substrate-binding protein